MFVVILLALLGLIGQPIEAISTYWTPIIPSFCSPKVSPNVTAALLSCDRLMDKQVLFTGAALLVLLIH